MPKKKSPKRKTSRVASASKLSNPRKPLSYLIAGFLVLLAILLLYSLKGIFVAAVVNGQPIFRLKVVSDLEKQAGKQALDSLVTQKLLLQEANRRGIVITEDEINNEVKIVEGQVKTQGQALDQLLEAQNLTMAEFRDRIRIQKIVDKLFEKEIQVSEKEIDKFIEENKETIPQEMSPQAVRQGAKEQLQQQKLNQQVEKLIARLKKEAKINYFVTY